MCRLLGRALDRRLSNSCYAYRRRGFGADRCQHRIADTLRSTDEPVYAMKRDISDYFASIDHAVLLEKLAEFVEPDDYLFELLSDCVCFTYHDGGKLTTARRGVPFGTAVACLLANIYLMDLDPRLKAVPRTRFFRYADDLLVLSASVAGMEQAGRVFDDEMAALRLASKPSHERDVLLTDKPAGSATFPACNKFRHLGLEFRADGSVGLARDKFRKIRNLFRFAFRKHRFRFHRATTVDARAKLAGEIARKTLGQGIRNMAIIDYYLRHVRDEAQLGRLDRWLAEEVLSLAFSGGHKKGYFRQLPYGRLQRMGLPSLVQRRRLILHGHVNSPFFVWRSNRINRGYGDRPPGRSPTGRRLSLSTQKQ